MALQSSGAISLDDIHVEAGGTTGTTATINDADIRGLIGKNSAECMSFSEWYGATANEFASLIGASDTGDWYLEGYGNQLSGTTITGNEGNMTWCNVYSKVKSCGVTAPATGITGFTGSCYTGTTSSTINSTGLCNTTHPCISFIEVRVYGSGGVPYVGHHNRFALTTQGPGTFPVSSIGLSFSFCFSTSDVNRGCLFGQSWSDVNNILRVSGSGRTTVQMYTANKTTNESAWYYQNNGGAVNTGQTSTRTISGGTWHVGSGSTCSIASPVIVGNLWVNRLVSTAELCTAGQWVYNDSTVNIHTGDRS